MRVHATSSAPCTPATSTPASSSGAARPSPGSARSTASARSRSPTGASLDVPTDVADLAFSYITLQHCEIDDALELAAESVRVVRAGGYVALNFRSRSGADVLLLPAGAVIRSLFRIPRFGRWLSQRRTIARFAWQANRLQPDAVIRSLPDVLTDVTIWRHPRSNVFGTGAEIGTFDGINPHHWWLVARIA